MMMARGRPCVCVCVRVCSACQQCKWKDRLIAAFEFQERNHNFESFGFRVNSAQKYQHQISAPASALWRISKQTREHKAKHRPGEKKNSTPVYKIHMWKVEASWPGGSDPASNVVACTHAPTIRPLFHEPLGKRASMPRSFEAQSLNPPHQNYIHVPEWCLSLALHWGAASSEVLGLGAGCNCWQLQHAFSLSITLFPQWSWQRLLW